jgi:hypothetical protein
MCTSAKKKAETFEQARVIASKPSEPDPDIPIVPDAVSIDPAF